METSLIILASLLLAAFFSGLEIAYISANKLRIELENKQGILGAKIGSFFVKHPSRFIGTMLVANNVCLVIFGLLMASVLEPGIRFLLPESIETRFLIVLLQTLCATLMILVACEFLPKVLFRLEPNKTLNFFAIPLLLVYYLLYPIVYLLISFAEYFLKKAFRIEFRDNQRVFGKTDLDHYIKEVAEKSGSSDGSSEIKMFQNALDFVKVKVRECMIPRNEIIGIEVEEPIENLRQKFVETGLSKILIYEQTIDHIIGFTHSVEMFREPTSIRSVLRPVSIVPETMPAHELMDHFTKQHKSIALVLDDRGLTSGIVTLEDVMEEIFGEIEDEHDTDSPNERQLSDNEFVFPGRTEIDLINEKYNLELPVSEEYETLAGLIFFHVARIPKFHEVIEIGRWQFTILSVSETRIERVKLKVMED